MRVGDKLSDPDLDEGPLPETDGESAEVDRLLTVSGARFADCAYGEACCCATGALLGSALRYSRGE
jgi:hypothetical protein